MNDTIQVVDSYSRIIIQRIDAVYLHTLISDIAIVIFLLAILLYVQNIRNNTKGGVK